MNKIPTTEELIERVTSFDNPKSNGLPFKDIKDLMIEFAKLHVEACKKEIAENATCSDDGSAYIGEWSEHWIVDEASIINAYPLDKII